jgi:hypothetical protein
MRPWALAASALLTAQWVLAESVTVGQTYPILERDALEEIQAQAAGVDWQHELSTANIRWSAKDGLGLARAPADRTRQVIPTYTLEFDVRDAAGQVIYPKGFQFNPLEHITLPYRIVVIASEHLEWAKARLKRTDMVILTRGDYERASQVLERPTFLLDEKTKARLYIEFAPSIIEQSGRVLVINEYQLEPAS